MTELFIDSAWKVVVAGLLLGAGLPALFAVGVRTTAVPAGTPQALAGPSLPRRMVAWLCYAVVLIAVAAALTVIVATGLGQTVSFEHIWPTFAPKA